MTTIAYNHKDKEVSVDSRYTRGSTVSTDDGVKYLEDGDSLWVFTGKKCDYRDLMKLSHNQKVDTSPDCAAILLKDKKAFYVSCTEQGYCEIEEIDGNLCLGSGQFFADSAMDFECCSRDAVKYAAKKDVYTGGKVVTFNIEGKNKYAS